MLDENRSTHSEAEKGTRDHETDFTAPKKVEELSQSKFDQVMQEKAVKEKVLLNLTPASIHFATTVACLLDGRNDRHFAVPYP